MLSAFISDQPNNFWLVYGLSQIWAPQEFKVLKKYFILRMTIDIFK